MLHTGKGLRLSQQRLSRSAPRGRMCWARSLHSQPSTPGGRKEGCAKARDSPSVSLDCSLSPVPPSHTQTPTSLVCHDSERAKSSLLWLRWRIEELSSCPQEGDPSAPESLHPPSTAPFKMPIPPEVHHVGDYTSRVLPVAPEGLRRGRIILTLDVYRRS